MKIKAKKSKVYCVCCEFPLNPEALPVHHEGKEQKIVPVCPNCHWALHHGSLDVRKSMKRKIHAWLKKQEKSGMGKSN